VASWADVERIVRGLPGIDPAAKGERAWRVGGKVFAWERPLRKSDLEALGEAAPKGAILAVHVPLEVKEMLLDASPPVYFTTPHFNGYPAILVRLGKIRVSELRNLLEEASRGRAAKPRRRRAR
jgi:hypothetical protein